MGHIVPFLSYVITYIKITIYPFHNLQLFFDTQVNAFLAKFFGESIDIVVTVYE